VEFPKEQTGENLTESARNDTDESPMQSGEGFGRDWRKYLAQTTQSQKVESVFEDFFAFFGIFIVFGG
jgi:hypothetical protein